MSGLVQSNQIITLPATTPYNVKIADSGKTLLVPALAAPQVINLPNPTAGLRYRFMVFSPLAAINQTSTITPQLNGAALNNSISGLISNSNGYIVKNGATTTNFADLATTGTFIDINSDGVKWIVFGYSGVAGIA